METLLDIIISDYYCKEEKVDKFKEDILNDRLGLRQKIDIFSRMELHKDKSFKGKYVGFVERLIEASSIRNKMAHFPSIGFFEISIKMDDQKRMVKMDETFLEEFEKFLHEIYMTLDEIMKLLGYQFGDEL